jgi:hypothetical protein
MKRFTITLMVILIAGLHAIAADYYWVGGSGNWSDFANHWATTSGGATFHTQAPTNLDNVYFDANSFSAADQVVTIDVDAVFASMDWSGTTNTPTLAGATNRVLNIHGSLTLIEDMEFLFLGTVNFLSLSTGNTITSAGHTFKRNVYFDGIGGWILTDDFEQTGGFSVFLIQGSLDLNDRQFKVNVFNTYSTTEVRSLLMRSSEMIITSSSSSAFYFRGENLTLNSGVSTIRFITAGANMNHGSNLGSGQTFHDVIFEAATGTSAISNSGGSFNNVVFNSTGSITTPVAVNELTFNGNGTLSGNGHNISTLIFNADATIGGNGTYGNVALNGNGSITGNNTFGTLTLTEGNAYTFTNDRTQLITTNLIAEGTCALPITIQSSTWGSQTSINKTSGAIVINYCVMSDINSSGGASFTANNTVDLGNNSGWTINQPAIQNLYWVGGNGDWNDPANWSTTSGGPGGSCIPSSLDNVFFDANSFDAPGQTVTLIGDGNNEINCRNMNWAGATNNPTIAGLAATQLNVYGSFTLTPTMNWDYAGDIYFKSTAAGNTVFTAGNTLGNGDLYLDGAGGGWTLIDGLDMGTKTLYLVSGSLNTNSQNVNLGVFNSNYTSNRELIFGASEFVISSTSFAALRFHGSNMTLDAGTSLVRLTGNGAGIYNISGGGLFFNDVIFESAGTGTVNLYNLNGGFNNLTFNGTGTNNLRSSNTVNNLVFSGNGNIYDNDNTINTVVFNGDAWIRSTSATSNNDFGHVTMNGNGTINGGNTFGTLIFSPGFQYTFQHSRTQVINDDLVADGTETELIIINSSSSGSQATLSKDSGTVTIEWVTLRDNEATGGATFNANNTVDLGNNTGWNITAPGGKDYYWVGGTGDWEDAANWSLTSGGAGGAGIPTILDDVFFDANSFSDAGQVVTILGDAANNANVKNMDWTGALFNPSIAGASTRNLRINGSLTLTAGMTWDFLGEIYFESAETGNTLTTAGVLLDKNDIYFQNENGSWMLMDDLDLGTRTLYLVSGSLNTNSQTVNVGAFNSNYSSNRELIFGSSEIVISSTSFAALRFNGTNMTLDAGTSLIRMTGNGPGIYNISGGGLFFNDVIFESATGGTADIYNLNGGFNNVTFNGTGSNNLRNSNTVNNLVFVNGAGNIYDNNNVINTVVFNGDAWIRSTSTTSNNDFGHVTMNGSGIINGTNTFGTLIFTPGFQYTFQHSRTQTINDNLVANGTETELIIINSSSSGSQATLSKDSGTVTIEWVTLSDNAATGGATFIANNTVDLGNNTGWNITAPPGKDYYWVGGTGDWEDAANWATSTGGPGGQGIPTILDNVFFDANSFTEAGQVVTILGDAANNANCYNMDWTGALFNPSIAGASTRNLRINGSITLTAGMSWDFLGEIYFESAETGNTLTTAGVLLDKNHIYFQNENGSWMLMDDLDLGTRTLYLVSGSLNTNSQTVNLGIFNSNYTSNRELTFGASEIVISSTSFVALRFHGSNMTLDAGTSLVRLTGNGAGIYNISGGGLFFNDVIFESIGTGTVTVYNLNGGFNNLTFNGTGTNNLRSSNTVNNLVFSGNGNIYDNDNTINTVVFDGDGWIRSTSVNTNNVFDHVTMNGSGTINGGNTFGTLIFSPGFQYTFQDSRTQTISDELVAEGTCFQQIIIESSSVTSQATISKAAGTVTINQVSLQGIEATGGADFIANNAINLGNNSGWFFSPIGIQDLYWVGGNGDWNIVDNWAAASGGPGGYCVPTKLDNVIFDENSFTQSGQAVFINIPNAECHNMDWSAVPFAVTFTTLSNTYNLKIHGSLTLNPDMNFAFSGPVYFEGESAAKSDYTIRMEGQVFSNHVYFNGEGATWTLEDNFSTGVNHDIQLNFGTLNTNDQMVSCRRFLSTNSNERGLNLGVSVFTISSSNSAAWNVTGDNMTITPGTSEIRLTTANAGFVSTGASDLVYNNVLFNNPGGSSTLNSNHSFNEVTFNPIGTVSGGADIQSAVFVSSAQIQDNNTFGEADLLNNTDITGSNTIGTLNLTPGRTYQLGAGTTQTILDELNFWGNSANPITIQSLTQGVQANFLKSDGTVSGNYIVLRDMNADGGATFNVYNSTDVDNNSGWNFLEPPVATCPEEDPEVCENADPIILDMALPAGWDYSGEGVYYDDITGMYMFDPALVSGDVATITYTIEGLFPGSCEFFINIIPLPQVECRDDIEVCEGSDYITLFEGFGFYYYQGNQISGFDPVEAGVYTITYVETNQCGEASCEFLIVVFALPEIEITGDLGFCEGETTTLTATQGASYLWSTGETTQSIIVSTADLFG